MQNRPRHLRSMGFSLIELLVVVAIIGILVAVLLPSISGIREKAKYTDATSQFRALETGLEAFRGESALGTNFPPSSTDHATLHKMKDPLSKSTSPDDIVVAGAHLLLQALVGADLLGPPGFKDVNRNGTWSDDSFAGPNGVYEVSAEGAVVHTRYGGTAGSYVDDKMKARVTSLKKLEEEGRVASLNKGDVNSDRSYEQLLFVDPWDRPVLYYRANPAARGMTGGTEGAPPGIYRLADNAMITGIRNAKAHDQDLNYNGVDFGAGRDSAGALHDCSKAAYPPASPQAANGDLNIPAYDGTFPRFIWDSSIKALNQPVRKDQYLLISAGPDGRYGSIDDVTNWPRSGR